MAKADIKKHEFKKGKSGNPKGRPKGSKNRSTLAKKWLEVSEMNINVLSGELEKLTYEDRITLGFVIPNVDMWRNMIEDISGEDASMFS